MIFDKQSLLSDAQAITADAASTNVINLGPIATGTVRNIGKGKKIPLSIQVVEAFNNLTSLEVKVQVDDNEAFATPKQVGTTGALALADLALGKRLNIDVIPRDADERFFRLFYDVTGTAPTSGKITAGVVAASE
ncbi:hypothetical protein ATY76_04520 [Rhizobium sp. R339]|uniref:Bbp16 family capsid cement protein n=1 Tax=Rhizobium sp. R339 TaxID=1764273 RepID=UPI000B52A4D4|nr:hypothetical protein [Rhizobium sp. R339]OWV77209.1 hypothetical protein ATY76_04520 [Rhizobium sp. R339]